MTPPTRLRRIRQRFSDGLVCRGCQNAGRAGASESSLLGPSCVKVTQTLSGLRTPPCTDAPSSRTTTGPWTRLAGSPHPAVHRRDASRGRQPAHGPRFAELIQTTPPRSVVPSRRSDRCLARCRTRFELHYAVQQLRPTSPPEARRAHPATALGRRAVARSADEGSPGSPEPPRARE